MQYLFIRERKVGFHPKKRKRNVTVNEIIICLDIISVKRISDHSKESLFEENKQKCVYFFKIIF